MTNISLNMNNKEKIDISNRQSVKLNIAQIIKVKLAHHVKTKENKFEFLNFPLNNNHLRDKQI
jgi:hypothetical protein